MRRLIEPAGKATRPAAVAGLFYPAAASDLRQQVDDLMGEAAAHATAEVPKALIAPHAGYVYSGPIAASAYAQIGALADRIRRVVLLGPVHQVPVRGLALPGTARFATPLGEIEVDTAAVERLRRFPQVTDSPLAHAPEHSLEVHLPFLQRVLGTFKVVPLVVGEATSEAVAEVIESLWGGPETLIVVSSDLSHYLPYAIARETDRRTVDAMVALRPGIEHSQACGATPVNGLLAVARERGLRAAALDVRNSGDTAGDRTRVVGYAAVALFESRHVADFDVPETVVQSADRSTAQVLLAHARAAIVEGLGLPMREVPDAPILTQRGATFVTLFRHGELRGCMGSLEGWRTLREDVRANARAAAFDDSRFTPLTHGEFETVRIEVSLLSSATPVEAIDERDLLCQLRPSVDGLILEYRGQRGTFLPQVWESLPEPREFLAHLKRKTALPADFWSPELRVSRYTVEKFAEVERS